MIDLVLRFRYIFSVPVPVAHWVARIAVGVYLERWNTASNRDLHTKNWLPLTVWRTLWCKAVLRGCAVTCNQMESISHQFSLRLIWISLRLVVLAILTRVLRRCHILMADYTGSVLVSLVPDGFVVAQSIELVQLTISGLDCETQTQTRTQMKIKGYRIDETLQLSRSPFPLPVRRTGEMGRWGSPCGDQACGVPDCWSCAICSRLICSMVGLLRACWALIWRANCGRCSCGASTSAWGCCTGRDSRVPPSSTVSVIFCNILNDFDCMGGERGSLQVDIGEC